jgi:hypothetical protein
MPMNHRLLVPRQTLHPEALAWRAAVIANGGTVSGAEVNAVSRFCNMAEFGSVPFRSAFLRFNPLMGGFLGALVPLFRGPSRTGTQYGNATDTNANFVAGDYSLASGLQSGVGAKRLSCGANLASNATQANLHAMIDGSGFDVGSAAANVAMGHTDGGFTNRSFFQTTTASIADIRWASSGGIATTPSPANITAGMLLATAVSATDIRFYVDGAQSGSTMTTNRGSAALEATDFPIFCLNQGTASYTAHSYCRAKSYSLGFGMTSAQVSAFRSALVALYSAVGRT